MGFVIFFLRADDIRPYKACLLFIMKYVIIRRRALFFNLSFAHVLPHYYWRATRTDRY